MTTSPKVAVIVLNWNGKDDTLECLDSVFRIDYPNFEVVVVDNGSSDDSVPAIRRTFPRAHLIETGANLGYAGGNNVGIRHALARGAEHVVILNNDTVVAPSLITELVETASRHERAGIVGPKIYYHHDPERIWSAGGYWDEKQQCFEQTGDGELDRGQYDQERPVEFLVGCCLLITRPCLEDVGLLEEDYFLNYEEIDLIFRAKRRGYQLVFCPKAKVWHKVSSSFEGENTPLKAYFTYRNRLLWASRHLPTFPRLRLYASVHGKLLNRIVKPAVATLRKNPKHLHWALRGAFTSPFTRTIYCAIRDFHRGRFGDCPPEIRALQNQWKNSRRTQNGI